METNTVVLSLSDYNELREFKEKMEEGYTYKLNQPYTQSPMWANNYGLFQPAKYITTDLALKELLERTDKITAINNELYFECQDLKYNRPNISKLKRMSIWEFIKWRKTK